MRVVLTILMLSIIIALILNIFELRKALKSLNEPLKCEEVCTPKKCMEISNGILEEINETRNQG